MDTHSVLGKPACRREDAPKVRRPNLRLTAGVWTAVCVTIAAGGLSAETLHVTPGFQVEDWLPRDEAIVLHLEGAHIPPQEHLAIVIGDVDVTALTHVTEDSMVYRPSLHPLQSGESQIVVYQVSHESDWTEVASIPIKVLSRGGFEQATFDPGLTINNEGQARARHRPEDTAPDRKQYQDFTGLASVQATLRRSNAQLGGEADVYWAERREQALRFSERGDAAAHIDLSSYALSASSGPLQLDLGSLQYGRSSLLLDGFAARGTRLRADFGAVDATLVASSGSSIAGWSNITGVQRSEHRMVSGRVGVDVVARDPGALRIDATWLTGSVLPQSDFNQGSITDAEQSRGWSVRASSQQWDGRIHVDGEFAQSLHTQRVDPLVEADLDLVPLPSRSRTAFVVRSSADVLKGFSITNERAVDLTFHYALRSAEPLYRSLGAYVQADQLQSDYGAVARMGSIALVFSQTRMANNRGKVASVLTTHTHQTSVNVSASLADAMGLSSSSWMPTVSYGIDRTHERGIGVPVNAGFSPTHVPNQVSGDQRFTASWNWGLWRLGYDLSYSEQDNRQMGRKNSDFLNVAHGTQLGGQLFGRVQADIALSRERSANVEIDQVDRLHRYAVRLAVQPTSRSTLDADWAYTTRSNAMKTVEQSDSIINVGCSYSLDRNRGLGIGGTLFVRYTRQESKSQDRNFGLDVNADSWQINSGFSVNLF